MKIEVAPEIFTMFPGYVRNLLVVRGADNLKEEPELAEILLEQQRRIREDESFEDIKNHPFITCWRNAFERFKVNPSKCPPSIANLIKRVKSGKDLPYVNSLVAIFNIISMKYVLPAGGDNLDIVKGDIRLTFAQGDENYTPLGLTDQREHPNPGEIVLLDTGNKEVFCRAWCWKNGDVSKIESGTKNVAINIDTLPPKNAEEGEKAALEAMDLIKRFCSGELVYYKLDSSNGKVTI